MITLTLKQAPTVVLEAETVRPDTFAGLSNAEIGALKIFHGKRVCQVNDFFDVDGERSDELTITGDLNRVRMIGRGMKSGKLTIHGNVGMHLASHMAGGTVEVYGNVSDWIGAEMSGGFIHIHGDAGGQIGAAYRGSLMGMRAGTVIVDGTAGIEIGMRMRRGTIIVGGIVRDFAGLQMKGGTIVLQSGAEIRTGAWMNRGTIISLKPLQIMPTFASSGSYNPTFINVYAKHLSQYGIKLPYAASEGSYQRYCGDKGVPGKGELLVWQPLLSS